MMRLKNIRLFIICALITLVAGGIGGYATASEIGTWYTTLEKPFFNPPNYLFGPVWTVLYFIMAFPLYSILKESNPVHKNRLLVIFSIQLVLNVLWSFLFFKFHLVGWAAIEMFILWLFIIALIIGVFQINKTTALLQIPYLLWVSFAFVLNFSIFYLN